MFAGMGDLSRLASRAAALPLGTGTTLDETILRGATINPQGYRRLVGGPAEPFVVREDLGGHALAGRAARRIGARLLVQFTDSTSSTPSRPRASSTWTATTTGSARRSCFSAAYRPHEMLTAQVTDALVRAVNARRRGPGHRPPVRLRDLHRRHRRQLPATTSCAG